MQKQSPNPRPARHPVFYTVDVEDYYHILGVKGTPPVTQWDSLPARVERGLARHFDLLAEHGARATLFFLGYIAKRFPHLVRKAVELGHEVASHGFYHQEVRDMQRSVFEADAADSRKLLEDLSGKEVRGWRSAGFTMGEGTPWFFSSLLEAGYAYDSSIVQNRPQHDTLFRGENRPTFLTTESGRICEFPITMAEFGSLKINMFGGGYLRFFPAWLLGRAASRELTRKPLLIYIHPRELDPGHPRLQMSIYRHFKSYVNLSGVPRKLTLLLGLAESQTLGEHYEQLRLQD